MSRVKKVDRIQKSIVKSFNHEIYPSRTQIFDSGTCPPKLVNDLLKARRTISLPNSCIMYIYTTAFRLSFYVGWLIVWDNWLKFPF